MQIDKLEKGDCNDGNRVRLLDNTKLAKLLSVSKRTLQEWRTCGIIPFIQIRGKILYRVNDIERVLQNNYYGERQY